MSFDALGALDFDSPCAIPIPFGGISDLLHFLGLYPGSSSPTPPVPPEPVDMTITPAMFRGRYRAFDNATAYPSDSVSFWLNLADLSLPTCSWSTDLRTQAIMLFTAHHLILEKRNNETAQSGATPGINVGALSGRTADKTSLSYDVGIAVDKDAGHWNLTNYGTRFQRMASISGMGGMQF